MASQEQNIYQILATVQSQIAVPKGQYNKFGGYYYRSLEDILNTVKPLLKQHQATIILDDELVQIGDRFYVKATASFIYNGEAITSSSYAREAEEKKGMDSSQVTGSCSSYARKYALDGLLAIGDTVDPDTTNTHGKNGQGKQEGGKSSTQSQPSQKPTQGTGQGAQKPQESAQQAVTKAQLSKVYALLPQLYPDDNKEQLRGRMNRWLENAGYAQVSSSRELTKKQATALIEDLEEMKTVKDQEQAEGQEG